MVLGMNFLDNAQLWSFEKDDTIRIIKGGFNNSHCTFEEKYSKVPNLIKYATQQRSKEE